ncbi:MAG: twin-arginine translocase subunit TatC [Acidobacteriota bacterium]|nr:twin-arginine translocase subunit TatC [Acidobacteriota bacterium]
MSESENLSRMTLIQHLEELRSRLVKVLLALAVTFAVCWVFVERIANFLARPIYAVTDEPLVFLGVTDVFILYVKVAALVGLFIASPIVLYQFWRFVSPGLYRRERFYALPFVFLGSLFFLAGGAFAYYVAFPFAVDFLIGMGAAFDPQITVDRYFGFLLLVILGLGLMFELPIVIFFLAQIGVVTPRFLIRHFRWAVLIIFVMAAVITPTPDVVNLCIFALPTILLYLLGVGAAALVPRKSPDTADEAG